MQQKAIAYNCQTLKMQAVVSIEKSDSYFD